MDAKEKPILFSAPMVRAILAGKKSQTRRVIASVSGIGRVTEFGRSDTAGYDWTFRDRRAYWNDLRHADLLSRCPYPVGTRLWVRETWAPGYTYAGEAACIFYAATKDCRLMKEGTTVEANYMNSSPPSNLRWRPSIHMPRWASRLSLEVADVRVQRLQDISADDVRAEGVPESDIEKWNWWLHPADAPGQAFGELWDSINSKKPGCSWADNPWVWAITFKVAS